MSTVKEILEGIKNSFELSHDEAEKFEKNFLETALANKSEFETTVRNMKWKDEDELFDSSIDNIIYILSNDQKNWVGLLPDIFKKFINLKKTGFSNDIILENVQTFCDYLEESDENSLRIILKSMVEYTRNLDEDLRIGCDECIIDVLTDIKKDFGSLEDLFQDVIRLQNSRALQIRIKAADILKRNSRKKDMKTIPFTDRLRALFLKK